MSYEKRRPRLCAWRALSAWRMAWAMLWPSTNWRPSNCTARNVAATTVCAPRRPIKPLPLAAPCASGKKCLDRAMAARDKRASTWSPACAKSARPSWSAVRAMAVSVSGTRSSASARRIRARPSALEIGYSCNKLSMAQNGAGWSRTVCTQGAASCVAAAQSSLSCKLRRRSATISASGR